MPYFAKFTTIGLARLATAQATSTPLVFTDLAVGDGNGTDIIPDAAMTALVRETARVAVNTVEIDPSDPNTVRVEGLVPAAIGNFWIREAGLFNAAGELIVIASYPPIWKPTIVDDGVSVDEYIRILLVYEAVSAIALTADPNVIMATRLYVDEQIDFWNSHRVKIYRENLLGVVSAPTNAQVPDYPLLRGHISGAIGGMSVVDPSATSPRCIRFNTTNVISAIHSFGETVPFTYMTDDRILSVEFDANVGSSDPDDQDSCFGMQDSSDVFSYTRGAQLQRLSDGTFQLHVAGASGGGDDEFDPVFGWQRGKIQCFGANTPHAVANGSAYTRLLLDDVEVARVDFVPDGAPLQFAGGVSVNSPDQAGVSLGGWTWWWLDHLRPIPVPPLTDAHVEKGFSATTVGSGDTHEYLDVTFDRDFPAATGANGYFVEVQTSLTSSGDPTPGWTIVNKTTSGFRINFTGAFNGEVRWRVYA